MKITNVLLNEYLLSICYVLGTVQVPQWEFVDQNLRSWSLQFSIQTNNIMFSKTYGSRQMKMGFKGKAVKANRKNDKSSTA